MLSIKYCAAIRGPLEIKQSINLKRVSLGAMEQSAVLEGEGKTGICFKIQLFKKGSIRRSEDLEMVPAAVLAGLYRPMEDIMQ